MAPTLNKLASILPVLAIFSMTRCNSPDATEDFTCAGKKVCAEMTSCAEAKFYLNQCGVRTMDGDNDGVPCEVEQCKR